MENTKTKTEKKARMSVTWEMNEITLNLVDFTGETAEYRLNCLDLPESIYIPCRSAQHGIEQKLRDNLAMSKETKAITRLSELVEKTNILVKSLKDGNWNVKGTGAKGETVKFEAIVTQLAGAIKTGIMDYTAASTMYIGITKKPFPLTEEEVMA